MTIDPFIEIEMLERLKKSPLHTYGFWNYCKDKFEESPTYENIREWLKSLEKSRVIRSEMKVVKKKPRREYIFIPFVTTSYLRDLKRGKLNESQNKSNELQVIFIPPDR